MKWFTPLSLIALTSCSTNQQHDIGKYVYVDCFNTVHIDRGCATNNLKNTKTKEERILSSKGVLFVDTCDFTHNSGVSIYPMTFCPKCIDDDDYSRLIQIINRNDEELKTAK